MLNPISHIDQNKEPPKVLDVAREYIQKPEGIQRMFFQPAIRAMNWMEFYQSGLSEAASLYRNVFKGLNQAFFWFDAPQNVKKVLTAVVDLKNSFATGDLWNISAKTNDTFIQSFSMVGLFGDSVSIVKNEGLIEFSSLGIKVLDTLCFLGNLALFLIAMKGIKNQFDLFIHTKIGEPEFILACVKLIAQISLLAIAFFGMYSFVYGAAVAKGLSLSVSTGFLIFALGGYFYDKMYVSKLPAS